MALDLVARSAAGSAATAAASALTAAQPAGLFNSIGSRVIDAAVSQIQSSGYSIPGRGAGTYVADALATAALAAAHPRLCKASSNGRYFRLVPSGNSSAISVDQAGATGSAGINDQPAIQAAVAYASAMDISWVEFPDKTYELWCPIRTTSPNVHGGDGHPIVITSTTGLGLRGLPGGTQLNMRNSTGGSKDSITQTVSGVPWQGGGVHVLPGSVWPGPTVDWIALENLIIDGGVTYNPADRSNTDLTDKGLWVQDVNCGQLLLRDVTLRNFAGEIYFVSGIGVNQRLTNVTISGSPQCALNAAPGAGTFIGINVVAGNSYQPGEILGGNGFTMIGGRFHDGFAISVFGGPDAFQAGYYYGWPFRDATKPPPWVRFIGTSFENTYLTVGSYTHFADALFTDTPISLASFAAKLTDITGRITSITDQTNLSSAVYIGGPDDLTTQSPFAPTGVYVEPPRNIRLEIVCKRTELAALAGRSGDGVTIGNGIIDRSCQFRISGEGHKAWSYLGTSPAGSIQPLMVADDFLPIPGAQPFGGDYDVLDADKVYLPKWSGMTLFNSGTSMRTITLSTANPYCNGQRVMFMKGEAGGNTVLFPANGSGLALDRDYRLANRGDLVELAFNDAIGKWQVSRFLSSTPQTLSASTAWDPPSIATGTSASTTITVAGAAIGDFAQASLGVSTVGLALTATVTAADTVTVVLANPTGGAIDLASTTLFVHVTKA